MTRPSSLLAAILLVSFVPTGSASAQPVSLDEQADHGDAVSVIVSPYVWAASLGGDVGLAGFGSAIHLPFSDILGHLDVAAMGNVEIAKGRGGVYLDAQYVKTSQQEQLLAMPVDLTVKITRISGGFFYKAIVVPLDGRGRTGGARSLSIAPMAGLHWTSLAIGASAPILQTHKRARWVDPFIGVRLNADLSPRWTLFAQADVGGFGISSTLSIDAQASLGYRLPVAGRPAILRLGYRYIRQDHSQRDFTGLSHFVWDTEQKGPVAGVSVVF